MDTRRRKEEREKEGGKGKRERDKSQNSYGLNAQELLFEAGFIRAPFIFCSLFNYDTQGPLLWSLLPLGPLPLELYTFGGPKQARIRKREIKRRNNLSSALQPW